MLSAGSAAEVGAGSDDLNMFKSRSVENTVGLRRSVRSAAHVEEQTACKPGFVNAAQKLFRHELIRIEVVDGKRNGNAGKLSKRFHKDFLHALAASSCEDQ